MKKFGAEEILERAELYGRTFVDENKEKLYFNWSLSGFEVDFCVTCLEAELECLPDSRPEDVPAEGIMEKKTVMVEDWPWIQVVLDGEETPYQKLLLDRKSKRVVLFSSDKVEHHRIRVVKLTENFRTAVAVHSLICDGELSKPELRNRPTIEFIGDSITCGFGNLATDGNRLFFTADEDAWLTHGAIAARKLDWKPSFVSISGFTLTKYEGCPFPHGMEDLYPYTDLITQEKLGVTENFKSWDFAKHPTDYLVLNIGTNDATFVMLSEEPEKTEQLFEEKYRNFLKLLRQLNGSETKIVCALGSIDYYLYDRICSAVEKYRKETQDLKVYTMKYTKMLSMGLDVGSCFHPSKSRQEKMAEELVKFLKKQVIE